MDKNIKANLIWIFVAGASYYLLAKLGMELFALKPGNITLLWLPSGIALVIYLQWGYRAFPLIFIASFAANFSGMSAASGAQAFLHTMIAAASDALTAMLAYRICQRYLPHGLVRPEDLLPFGLGVCLLPAFVSGLILALNLLSGGYIVWNELGSMIRMITLADNMGILLVYPLYQGWLSGMRLPATEQRWVIAAAMTITVLLLLSFAAMPGLLYFCLPVMSLLAFYAGFTGVAALGSLSVIVIIAATAQGLGPFLSVDAVESNFELMSFSYAYMFVVLGTALLMRDIAHRKATEAALLHSETKFKTLFESSAEAVMLLDSRGFFDCNRATLQMFGCASREEFCAKHPSDLAPPLQPDGTNSFEFASKKIMTALKIGCELFEYQHRRADNGRDFPAEVLLSAMELDARPVLLATVRDITERQRAEAELLRHRDHLQEMVAERTVDLLHAKELAEQANQAKSEFLTNMSHELRTPLHATLAFARMGFDKHGDASREKLGQYFSRIQESAERLTLLVDDLLDLSKLDAGQMALQIGRVDLVGLTRTAIAGLGSRATEKNIGLNFDCTLESAPINADAARINQVLSNILENAIKFSGSDTSVQIRLGAEQGGYRLEISDQGPGIPAEEFEHIFERFSQSSKTRTGAGGTGLGLSIANEIMRLHHGTISAANNPQRGACFTMRFPVL